MKKEQQQQEKLINLCKLNISIGKFKTFADCLTFLGIGDVDHSQCEILFPNYTKDHLFKPNLSAFSSFIEKFLESLRAPALVTPTTVTLPEELDFKSALDTELPPYSPLQKCFLFNYQKKPTLEIYRGIVDKGLRAQYLSAGTGTGKTVMYFQILRWLKDSGFIDTHSFAPYPMMVLTKTNIIDQTLGVARDRFGFDPEKDGLIVTSYDQLRSGFGKRYIKETTVIVDGEPEVRFKWFEGIHPLVIVIDEGHSVKNEASLQSRQNQALKDLKGKIHLIYTSATPIARVSDAKAFALNIHMTYSPYIGSDIKIPLDEGHWKNWTQRICGDSKPEDYHRPSVKRLTDELEPYIQRVTNVHFQFKPRNACKLIGFSSDWERNYYMEAEERFIKEKEELEGKIIDGSESHLMRLAIMNKYREAAEFAKAYSIAKLIAQVVQSGKAGFAAVNFRATVAKITQFLVNDFCIPRDKISLIWGGSSTYSGTEEKVSNAEIKRVVMSLALGNVEDIGILEKVKKQLLAQRAGLGDIDPSLRLGVQSKQQRFEEKLRYQKGLTDVMIYTLKSGGVGLDLHHTDDYTKEKVRRRPSGWAYTEDIHLIPTKPRKGYITPTLSAVEFVQGSGRTARVTSLSDTEQDILFYKGTIEEKVAIITSNKLLCMKEMIRSQEHWEDAMYFPDKYKVSGGIAEINTSNEDIEAMNENEEEDEE